MVAEPSEFRQCKFKVYQFIHQLVRALINALHSAASRTKLTFYFSFGKQCFLEQSSAKHLIFEPPLEVLLFEAALLSAVFELLLLKHSDIIRSLHIVTR